MDKRSGLSILRGIADAAAHLHKHGVMHGDLYAHNTMVSDDGRVAIGDFGAAFMYGHREFDFLNVFFLLNLIYFAVRYLLTI
jgi:serine/threonine protein kinase